MPDIIHLLPDNIANQIAAGEVIQRPASAVKELLENAVDAGATDIQLFVNDAGKALIQVIDNGKGMSETDARMAFERHATSKIRSIDDLFSIKTMGFRGEALASIAAVAQVELKTKRPEDSTGVLLEVENSTVLRQEPVGMADGTSIAMKNLFFNVPARRNFLKSNASELRHIVEEFVRVAMSYPDLYFSLTSNGQEVFHLDKGSLKQRIVQILGNSYNAKLVTVQEQTDYMDVSGFVGKPETAKKTRGDQYFFVNNRFIKSPYLNHAVVKAFDNMIPKDAHPTYAIFITINPAHLDVNVHPTKQEIKFDDERIVYAFMESAVKHALAQFSISPTLDFELDASIQNLDAINKPFTSDRQAQASSSSLYNTFTKKNQAHLVDTKSELKHWKSFYEGDEKPAAAQLDNEEGTLHKDVTDNIADSFFGQPMQLQQSFVMIQNAGGFLLLQQQNAHERVLYERFSKAVQGKPMASQQSLFPETIEFATADAVLLTELLPDLELLGFKLEAFGGNSFIIQATPADLNQSSHKLAIEAMLEKYKHFSSDIKYSKREKLLRSLAQQQSIKSGVQLSDKEMNVLIEDLFACEVPSATPTGKPTYMTFKKGELDKMFGR